MQGQSSENFYSSSRFYGGVAIGYTMLTEVDFTAAAGAAYSPPEVGDYRRINVTRCLQLVSDCSSIIETFQTSAAEVRLPASSATNETIDDAGPGRFIVLKNQGTGTITIKDYLGTTITTVLSGGVTFLNSDDNNNWDYYFRANQIPHEIISAMETSTTVQTGLEYLMRLFRDVLREPTGFLNKYYDSIVTYNNTAKTMSIAPINGSFVYYIAGKIFTVSSIQTASITNNEGWWYFYFNSSGTFVSTQTEWDIRDNIAPAIRAYWDVAHQMFLRISEERHGLRMDADSHQEHHATEGPQLDIRYPPGLQIINYIETGDGSLNTHAQYGVSDGWIYDEDLPANIRHAASPVNLFEQRLTAPCYLPVFYLLGSGVPTWHKKDATVYPFYENIGTLPYYNQNNAGTWSTTTVTNGYYFATWHCYSLDLSEPVWVILGQRQDTNLIDAVNNNTIANLTRPRQFTDEVVIFKKVIWEASTSYTNAPKCRLRYIALNTEVNAANDRYAAICNYNGNAGVGKYLEFYPGQSSDLSPYPIPEPSFLKTIVLTAVANSTGTISVYKSTDLVNAITTISLANSLYAKSTLALVLNTDDKLVTKVSSGSINKPAMTIFIQTNL